MAKTFVFVGCLNRRLPYFPSANGKGIAVYSFDAETGDCLPGSLTEGIDNPTYLAFDPVRSCLYATSEVAGWNEGTVSACRFDAARHRIIHLNKQATLGSIAAHCSLSRDGRFLLVANYGDGAVEELPRRAVAVFPIRADGGLDPACGWVAHRGSGPNPARQERPHAHCALASPDGDMVVVADLGIDAVLCHRLGADGTLASDPSPLRLPPGSGPRQIAFHPTRPFAYAVSELNSTICAIAFAGGAPSLLQTVPTVPSATDGENYPADLQFGPDGRFLYGSNRGHDSIVIHAVDPATGRLALVGHCPGGGRTPRSFAIDPSGRWLLVANQNSDCIALFAVNPQDGTLSDTGRALAIGTPMCVKFGMV